MKRTACIAVLATLLSLIAAPAIAQETKPVEVTPAPPEETGFFEVTRVQLFVNGAPVDKARPDQTTTVRLTLTNRGEKAANDVTGALGDEYPGIRIVDGTATFGDLAAGASGTGELVFAIADASCEPQIGFAVGLKSSLGESATKFLLEAACPGARLSLVVVEYEGGDGDTIPEPGELLRVFVTLHNSGDDPATDVRATLKLVKGEVTVVDGTAAWPDIESGKTAKASQPFVIQIAPDAKRADGCSGVDGGVVTSDGAATRDGTASDTPVSSDGSTMVAPAPDSTSGTEPGSTGSGAPGSEPGSEPNTGSGTIEPDTRTIEPEPVPTTKDEPVPAPEPTGFPSPADAPVELSALATVTASGKTFEFPVDSGLYCAYALGKPGAPADGREPAVVTDEARDLAAESTRVASKTNAASVASVVVVIALAVLAALSRRLPLARLIRFTR